MECDRNDRFPFDCEVNRTEIQRVEKFAKSRRHSRHSPQFTYNLEYEFTNVLKNKNKWFCIRFRKLRIFCGEKIGHFWWNYGQFSNYIEYKIDHNSKTKNCKKILFTSFNTLRIFYSNMATFKGSGSAYR